MRPPSPARLKLPHSHGERGFTLVAVLWVTIVLAIIALGYATTARMNGVSVRNSRIMHQERYLMESALELGMYEFRKYERNRSLLANKEEVEANAGQELDLWYPRFEPFMVDVEGTELGIRLVNESGKINVNLVDKGLWDAIVKACGIEDEDRSTAMFDALRDWVDGDDLHRAEGAENDYYTALFPPYQCKNGPIESLEELLLIKDITPDLYYGTDEHPGLVDYLSVAGKATRLDVNTSSPDAFRIIKDITPEAIEGIVARRFEKPITGVAELSDIVPVEAFSQLKQYFSVQQPDVLSIEVAKIINGKVLASKIRRLYVLRSDSGAAKEGQESKESNQTMENE